MQSSQATKPTPLSLSLVFSIFTSPPSLPPSSRRVPFHHHPIPPFPFISERAMAAADLFPLPHHHAGFGFGFGGQSVHSPVFLPPLDPALPPSPRGKREAVKPKAVHTHSLTWRRMAVVVVAVCLLRLLLRPFALPFFLLFALVA